MEFFAFRKALFQALEDEEVVQFISHNPNFKIEVQHKHGGTSWIMKPDIHTDGY